MSLRSEQEIENLRYTNQQAVVTNTAAGASNSLSASSFGEVFQNSDQVCYQVSCAVSANNAGIDATFDNSTWYRLLTVSGVGVTSGSTIAPYINYRGFVDTYSSGTVRFDFIQRIN